ncbi:MAG: AgmX/PglI C-terminal domain-containing protein [Sandaracinus sp.]|nr:AgmX/PglI C-terminal domain-containing protein [Sandaracinus sp.]MCB9636413.1 AgmX/PglI C-terminal domain-containing protein [Sandaracinus sp.]
MYCQSCGASNSDDAKFCNQCGGRIAAPGDVGGLSASPAATAVGLGAPAEGIAPPSAPAAPAAGSAPSSVNVWEQQQTSGAGGGPSMMSVSLETIGVKSTKKVWAGIFAIAVVLVALGALGSWLLRGDPEVVADAGHAQPEDPFVIGTPLPNEGDETPTEPVVEPTEPEPSTGTAMSTSTMRSTTSSGTTTMTSTGLSGGTTTMTSSGTTSGGTSTGGTSAGGTTTMTTTGGSTGGTTTSGNDSTTGGSTTGGGTTGGGTTGGGTTGGGTTGGGSTPDLGGEVPEERDLELELYGSRVRFVVQRYYAARAQTCFDRATRNNPSVSGTVVVKMTIGADGHVSGTSIVRNTTGDEVLGNCLRSQVGSWQLPPPPGGSLEMQMPFSR